MRPQIFYVDDEPHNLTVFEASVPEDWEVIVFDHPLKALEALEKYNPSVILTDQRMPEITGVKFLELVRKINNDAVRIVVTGYSDENLIIESVRKAQVFDYITKPWDPEDLENSLHRAIRHFDITQENKSLLETLQTKNKEIEEQNRELIQQKEDLRELAGREEKLRKELECWVPPFILWSLNEEKIQFPIRRDIVGVTFDIVKSSRIHDVWFGDQSIRSRIIRMFSEAVLRHGGWRESHSGDSAYGHFGLFEDEIDPCDSALAVAREFRVGLQGLSQKCGINVECGIALHICRNATVDIHEVALSTPRGTVVQKSFDTTSIDIDILHKMEKIVHELPGSNIIFSKEFKSELSTDDKKFVELTGAKFSGHINGVELFLLPSDYVTESDLESLKVKLAQVGQEKKKAA